MSGSNTPNAANMTTKRAAAIALILLFIFCAMFLFAGCDGTIDVAGKKVSPDVTELNLNGAGLADISNLKKLKTLQQLDLRNNDISIEQFQELKTALPRCEIVWSVPIDGMKVDSDATMLADPNLTKESAAYLSFFPNLKQVDATGSADYGALKELITRYPQYTFHWNIVLGAQTWANTEQNITLTSGAYDLNALQNALAGFLNLNSVDLRESTLTTEEKQVLAQAYPNVTFVWSVEVLPGITASSADQELILSNHPVSDLADLADKLKLLPGLTRVEMCDCGLSDEQMQSLRESFPKIKFIWLIRVGFWELRTDVVAFSLANVKPFPGGRLVGDEYWRYSKFTAESLEPLKYCTDLVALDIGHASNVKDLSNLAGLTKLKYLIVAMTRATDIEVIGNMPDLVFLEIFSMPIRDLSPLLACKNLEYLNCGNCKFKSIDELVQLKSLKRLWIINSSLKEAQIDELKAKLPDTIVKTGGDHPTDSGWRSNNPEYVNMRKLFHLGW